ncbi:MAG: UDP-N-acetylmuramate dehydrogenase [Deferribacteraceae bacterium]|jgi:UDP-N-acetylmuramate dehydrogenase|nr:UDP-N-acetylmuramate dehydrogenase [Deferribacteraceae bacterium]
MDNTVQENVDLNEYCTYRTGGKARYLACPLNTQNLTDLLEWSFAVNVPHEIIGSGANLLISDSGYDGLIICLRNFEKWCIRKGDTVLAGSGTLLNDAVKYACGEGLSGAESLSGIPGTLGGAIRMNAGAYGTEIKDIVTRLTVLQLGGNRLEQKIISAGEAKFGYRSADGLSEKIVIAAEMNFTPSDSGVLNEIRKDILARRVQNQPLKYPSCGSVFKRPQGNYAGALIEKCGLKGFEIGGAQVSEKHANFIINTGNATSSDIYKLIAYVKAEVYKANAILLEEEVHYLGKFPVL